MTPMRSCRRATQLLSIRRDRPLVMSERVWLRIHLAVCIHCRRFSQQVDLISDMMRNLPDK